MHAQRRKALAAQIVKELEYAQETAARLNATFSNVKGYLKSLRDEEQEHYDSMPESMQGGNEGDIAQTAINAIKKALVTLEDPNDIADKEEAAQ